MIEDPLRLVQRHRSAGVLIDTNLALLLLVGAVSRRRIPQFKRTRDYTLQDFQFLVLLLDRFERTITTPHVLAELSNLGSLHGDEFRSFRHRLAAHATTSFERYSPAPDVVRDATYLILGITDAAIAVAASQGALVLTDDWDLYAELIRRRLDVIHFRTVSPGPWL